MVRNIAEDVKFTYTTKACFAHAAECNLDYLQAVQDIKKYSGRENELDKESSILSKEIKSWEKFEYALREENATLFKKMLTECEQNEGHIGAANSKDEYFSAESLFMVLIL